MNTDTYIQLNKVSKSFQHFKAVDQLSMTVDKGDIYGFLGPNGAGKSTSIRMMLSLIRPDSGEIKLFGQDFKTHRYQTLGRLGALVEKPDFYKYLSAKNNLKILGRLSKIKNLGHRIDEVLDIVGLLSRRDSKVKTYSQGMRQRLGIAQALLHQPELILLDEPANGLDPQGQKEMRTLIQQLNREQGITILISSHILIEIEQIANRMIIINKGKSVVEGSVDDLLNESDMQLQLTVNDSEKTNILIQSSRWQQVPKFGKDNQMILTIDKKEIPALTAYLINSGIEIFGLEPKRSLEDYFIRLTAHE